MTEFNDCYLIPIIPKDQKPVFPEFDIDEKKPLVHNEEKVKNIYFFLLNFIEAYLKSLFYSNHC